MVRLTQIIIPSFSAKVVLLAQSSFARANENLVLLDTHNNHQQHLPDNRRQQLPFITEIETTISVAGDMELQQPSLLLKNNKSDDSFLQERRMLRGAESERRQKFLRGRYAGGGIGDGRVFI